MKLTASYVEAFPERLLGRYEFHEVRNAAAIFEATNPDEFADLVAVLDEFYLYTDDLLIAGGQESDLAARLNGAFRSRGWREARVDTIVELAVVLSRYKDDPLTETTNTRTVNEGYKVDNFIGRVALDVEWNAKDGNLDRDLGAYRFLYDQGLIDLGVIVTRTLDLRMLGRTLALEAGWTETAAKRILGTTTTTNTDKLLPRMTRGGSGGCPVLVVAISDQTWAGRGVAKPTDVPLAEISEDDELPTTGGVSEVLSG